MAMPGEAGPGRVGEKRAKASESEAREWAQYIVHKVRKTIDTIEGPGKPGWEERANTGKKLSAPAQVVHHH